MGMNIFLIGGVLVVGAGEVSNCPSYPHNRFSVWQQKGPQ
jgi:hypothetical protein